MSVEASIAGVLALVEKHGTVVVLARSLEPIASTDAREALHVAGVLAGAPAAPTWPCDVRGCAREIRANYDGARRPLVAVCCQAPPACAPVELGFDEVAQQEVSVEALVTTACGLMGATVDRAALAKLRERRAIGEARAPVLVAAAETPARDVFWAGSPRDTDLAAFCARRERVPRASVVLVPTGKHVPLDVAARFAAGEQVEVRALSDVLEVRGGKLALAEAAGAIAADVEAKADAAPAAVQKAPSGGIAAIVGATRWEEIRILVVDGHTVRIEANGKSALRTFVELGFVDGRKTDVVTPTSGWLLFLLFCKKGELRPSEYAELGKAYGAKAGVKIMQKVLRAAFGIEEAPIRAYSRRTGRWVARFRVAGAETARAGRSRPT